MRILLQQISSGYFLTEKGDWAVNKENGKDFEHLLRALLYAREHLDDPVSAYCAFSDPRYDFSLYLNLSGFSNLVQLEKKVRTLERLCENPESARLPRSRCVRPQSAGGAPSNPSSGR